MKPAQRARFAEGKTSGAEASEAPPLRRNPPSGAQPEKGAPSLVSRLKRFFYRGNRIGWAAPLFRWYVLESQDFFLYLCSLSPAPNTCVELSYEGLRGEGWESFPSFLGPGKFLKGAGEQEFAISWV